MFRKKLNKEESKDDEESKDKTEDIKEPLLEANDEEEAPKMKEITKFDPTKKRASLALPKRMSLGIKIIMF